VTDTTDPDLTTHHQHKEPAMYSTDYTPRPQSRTSRNDIKKRIRNRLGTGGDGAPSTYRTLLAAQDMAELLYLATDGRLKLELKDGSGSTLNWLTALGSADRDDSA
jgi:hypothetical protein